MLASPNEAAISCLPATDNIHFLAAALGISSAGTFAASQFLSSIKSKALLFNI